LAFSAKINELNVVWQISQWHVLVCNKNYLRRRILYMWRQQLSKKTTTCLLEISTLTLLLAKVQTITSFSPNALTSTNLPMQSSCWNHNLPSSVQHIASMVKESEASTALLTSFSSNLCKFPPTY
jgi:hypothetical protein